MFKSKNLLVALVIFIFSSSLFAVDDPDNPKDPVVGKGGYNIEFQRENGFFSKGYAKDFENFYLKNLTWKNNLKGEQKISIDSVKSIRIKGYSPKKVKKENLSLVFYIPYVFDIELTNGTKILDASGRINEIESFYSYDEKGKVKLYTYFMRYWLEDKGIFLHNNSNDFDESPEVPEDTVVYVEFGKRPK